MDVNRAQQILQSNETIEVKLNGENVWIDSVDTTSATAKVHPKAGASEALTVSVKELQEV